MYIEEGGTVCHDNPMRVGRARHYRSLAHTPAEGIHSFFWRSSPRHSFIIVLICCRLLVACCMLHVLFTGVCKAHLVQDAVRPDVLLYPPLGPFGSLGSSFGPPGFLLGSPLAAGPPPLAPISTMIERLAQSW